MTLLDFAFASGFLAAFGLGIRSTWRLWRRYRTVTPLLLDPRERLVLGAFVIVSVLITTAAGYFGLLTVRRIIGFEPLEFTPIISLFVVIVVLLIPVYLDQLVQRVARR